MDHQRLNFLVKHNLAYNDFTAMRVIKHSLGSGPMFLARKSKSGLNSGLQKAFLSVSSVSFLVTAHPSSSGSKNIGSINHHLHYKIVALTNTYYLMERTFIKMVALSFSWMLSLKGLL